ncbi:LOW QUALITY PROTEIN: lysozyme g-like protein 1 [Megaptera novaeangliae]
MNVLLSPQCHWGPSEEPGLPLPPGSNEHLSPIEVILSRSNGKSGLYQPEDPGLRPTSWISKAQVSQMTEVLTVRIKEIQRRFPTWTPDQHLRALCNPWVGFPAWVNSSQDLSCDFSNDVLARAKYFKRQGF